MYMFALVFLSPYLWVFLLLSVLPTVAAPVTSGDCTFEEDACGWANPSPRQRIDNLDFLRIKANEQAFPPTDHTTADQHGEEEFGKAKLIYFKLIEVGGGPVHHISFY